MAVKIGKLAKEVMKQLGDYGVEVGLIVQKATESVAKETAETLTRTSPELTGDYKDSWTYGVGETKRTKHIMIVHAKKPEYALTHLLEKGHQKRDGGKTEPIVHIEPAEKEAVSKLMKEIEKNL